MLICSHGTLVGMLLVHDLLLVIHVSGSHFVLGVQVREPLTLLHGRAAWIATLHYFILLHYVLVDSCVLALLGMGQLLLGFGGWIDLLVLHLICVHHVGVLLDY